MAYRSLEQPAGKPHAALAVWLGYLAMCIGMFMAILDIQIVAGSLPEIAADLGVSPSRLSWIQTVYLIAEIIAIPLTGWLTRLLTLRILFVAAVTGFTLASVGCATVANLPALALWRAVQGFSGGALIPTVFTAVFLIFPEPLHIRATLIAGVTAMLAPTLGPALGGYITETYGWRWIFLLNLGPGVFAAVVTSLCLTAGSPQWRLFRELDRISLVLFILSLAAIELALKEAPEQGWLSGGVLWLLLVHFAAGAAAIRRSLGHSTPVVDFRVMAEPAFAAASFYSFVLGAGLYGSVYLLPVFLGLVRHHGPLEIGGIMIVTGFAQLVTAPLAAMAERRSDPRFLTALGYSLFGTGLILNGFQTYQTDFDALVLPQILRGCGVMLCLLPTTSIALESRENGALAGASGLFNAMRNLGGAIGIAVVDTMVRSRFSAHVEGIVARLQAGDPKAAIEAGLPVERFHNVPLAPIDQATRDFVEPLIERAATVASFNDAWLALGCFFLLSLCALPFLKRAPLDSAR